MSVYESTSQTTVGSTTEYESTISRRVEPTAYSHYEEWGREAMRKTDLQSEVHKEECVGSEGR